MFPELLLKRFFEILPNETEQQVNRKLFQNLTIEKEKGIMDEHFGKHPIIYLNYKPKSRVYSLENARYIGYPCCLNSLPGARIFIPQ